MPLPQGHLSTKKLPAELGRQIWQGAVSLHCRVETAMGEPVDLWLTDNRRSMVSIRRNNGRCQIRLHHMFVGAPVKIIQALATLHKGRTATTRDRARATLTGFTRDNADKIRRRKPKRRIRVRTQGEVYDLEALYADMVAHHLDADPGLTVTWGRWGRPGPRKSIRLGSYDPRRQLIRIHPLLDRESVPAWVIQFVLYHEALHHLYPPIRSRRGRNKLHHEEFLRQEALHPDHDRFEQWQVTDLNALMDSAERK
ncbi:MAG: hypothetical protein CMH57_12880 [Myxococcales bacterium]|nr:hypothetical protein [Myxococcales bacterium]